MFSLDIINLQSDRDIVGVELLFLQAAELQNLHVVAPVQRDPFID
jgi:hypothetical protein